MSRASNDAMDSLHALVARTLEQQLREDPIKALASAIKFLKDNGIDAPASAPRFSGIVDQLKSLEVGDDDVAWQ